MQPRFIIRTHREVSRPGIFTALIRRCTSANRSLPQSAVADRLAKLFKGSKKFKLSGGAGKNGGADFAVEMAQKFGFLTSNCFWDWKGQVINTLARQEPVIPDDYLVLTPYEQLMYLRYYLEAEGAVILEFAKILLKLDNLSKADLLNSSYVEEIFLRIWQGYLSLTQELTGRLKLKNQISGLKHKAYDPDTRRHKFIPILIPLRDFRLVDETEVNGDVVYSPAHVASDVPLQTLVEELRDFELMEARFKGFDYYAIIAKCFNFAQSGQMLTGDCLRNYIAGAYDNVKQEGTGLASIDAIVDVVCVKLLCDYGQVATHREIVDFLEARRLENPYSIHFYLDRRGERAYVVIRPEALAQLKPT